MHEKTSLMARNTSSEPKEAKSEINEQQLITLAAHFKDNPYFNPSTNSMLDFFSKPEPQYCNGFKTVEFRLEDILPLITNDDAEQLFSTCSRFKDIIPAIQKETIDPDTIEDIMTDIDYDRPLFSTKFSTKFIVDDLCFIGLIPSLVAFKAVNSFDLFIKAFLAWHLIYNTLTVDTPMYTVASARSLILNIQDDYFIQRYLFLLLNHFPLGSTTLYKEIRWFANLGKTELICEAIENLPEKRHQELSTLWCTMEGNLTLLTELYPERKSQYELHGSLRSTTKSLENNHFNNNIEELIAAQKEIQARFQSAIEAAMKAQEENTSSFSFK